MRKTVLKTLIIAALPITAGFAFSVPSYAQPMRAQSVQAQSGYAPQNMGTPQPDMALLRVSQLENQIRDLTGQLEQREYQLRQLQESYDRFVESTNARLMALEGGAAHSGASAQSSTPYAAPQPNAINNTSAQSHTLQNRTPSAPENPQPTPVNPTDFDAPYQSSNTGGTLGHMETASQNPADDTLTSGRPQNDNPAQAYDRAFGFLQDKNYTDAENAFQDFIKNHGTHALAGNAQYWLGETYYAQTQYTAAARVFAKAFQDYPQGQKAPDALFKLALTLEKMNKREDACLTLSELRKRFPTGPASILRRATEESTRMQCAA